MSSPNLLFDDYDICELDFIDPLTDHGQADYLGSSLPPQCSDLLIHSQMGSHGNWKPAVQSGEEMNSNRNRSLGLSFNNKRNSSFVEWKSGNPLPPRLCSPHNSSSLQKRCIRFLNVINKHKVVKPLGYSGNWSGMAVPNNNYDKLAIHHVVAERKRRAQMGDVFSALRDLVPLNTKNGSRATVLESTKDYVIHLKKRVQQLEERNRELEALFCQKSDRSPVLSFDLLP